MLEYYSEIVDACRAAQERGEEVATPVARAIAGQWHSGQGSPFYAFCSSGHYDRDALLRELSETIALSYRASDDSARLMLDMMGTYLVNRHA